MKIYHKVWDSMHHVKAVEYAHLCVDWPIGTALTEDNISQGEFEKDQATIEQFMLAAKKVAYEWEMANKAGG